MVSRRAVLAGLAGLPLAARAAPALRLAVLDWGLAETCLALGCVPAGVPAPSWYDRYAVEPAMPSGVPDIGLLFTPNFEALQEIAPDALVIPPALTLLRPYLQRIAPLIVSALFRPAPGAYGWARTQTEALAAQIGHPAAPLLATTEAALAAARMRLAGYDGRPLLVLSVLDARHVNVFGPNSLHADVLGRLGLSNAWTTPIPGEFTTIGVEQLASFSDARIIAITPGGGDAMPAITGTALWQALDPVRAGRVVKLPPVLGSGGLPAASRLAGLLAAALA